ncbi:unnamed protein product [Euphydryas editha]|uniref:Endonuclease/exonuclease/phosphatase domain-containing protein n=1 Tax=Euphydryas editha TaxID=104508 RepID=A0AAU9TWL3_EUPED|nr:unnamed protein product [Euphydryas editha]
MSTIVKCVSSCLRTLCWTADIITLQETWFLPHDLLFLETIDEAFAFTGKSAVDTSQGILLGRPFSAVALLWRKFAFPRVSVLKSHSLEAVKTHLDSGKSMLAVNV